MIGIKNLIVFAVLALILGAAICYIVTQKKKGSKCIGCPYAKNCGGNTNSCQMKR